MLVRCCTHAAAATSTASIAALASNNQLTMLGSVICVGDVQGMRSVGGTV